MAIGSQLLMDVIATAGHIDHGKSTLIRALTGMDTDRWPAERRRGMTIDLGFAWTTLDDGRVLAFVDVPGHERFINNMLAGLGPVPAVLFVVAADEGWRAQSEEHLEAVTALGLTHGLLAITRADRADPSPAARQAIERIAQSSLRNIESIAVSAVTGFGLADLRAALGRLGRRLPTPTIDADIRLWVDRSFTIRGVGTVVTATLAAGTVHVGDELQLRDRRVRVRGLQSLGVDYQRVSANARIAVNLRAVAKNEVRRGDTLLSVGAWRNATTLDGRLSVASAGLPRQLTMHLGTAAVPVHIRPLGNTLARLTLGSPLPLRVGDRGVLRDPGSHAVMAGVRVLDADPPQLKRRGAAAERAAVLTASGDTPDLAEQVRRRGAVDASHLAALGIPDNDAIYLLRCGDLLIDPHTWQDWADDLLAAVDRHTEQPLTSVAAWRAMRITGRPSVNHDLLSRLAEFAGLQICGGKLLRAGHTPRPKPSESALAKVLKRLTNSPFDAPDRAELVHMKLAHSNLVAAQNEGKLLLLANDVVLLPDAPTVALEGLCALDQPFTASQARRTLGTTRRIVIPLLEHLDSRGWTLRIDEQYRRVREGIITRSREPT